MGINRLLIDGRIQGIWLGHTKTGRDRLRAGMSGGGAHAAWPGTPACSGSQRVGWSLQWLHGWSIHSNVDRVTDANTTVGDCARSSWLSQGVQNGRHNEIICHSWNALYVV